MILVAVAYVYFKPVFITTFFKKIFFTKIEYLQNPIYRIFALISFTYKKSGFGKKNRTRIYLKYSIKVVSYSPVECNI